MATEHGDYRDLSPSIASATAAAVVPPSSDTSTTLTSTVASASGSHRPEEGATNVGNFPTKLHYVLSELERTEKAHIASWAPHGRCFKVHKPQEFVNQVLGLWFRQTKLASFQRQLNIYGFNRIMSGPDKGGYYHELFLRGRISLTKSMPRMSIKPPGLQRRSGDPGVEEPNFYRMPFVGVGGPLNLAATRSESAVVPSYPPPSEQGEVSIQTTRASSNDFRVISDMLQGRIDRIRSEILSNVSAPLLLSSSLPLRHHLAVSSRPVTTLAPPRAARELYDTHHHGLDVYSLPGAVSLPASAALSTQGLGGAQSLPHADTAGSGGHGGLAGAIIFQAVSVAREREAAASLGALPLHWQQHRNSEGSSEWDRQSLVAAALAAPVTRSRCGTYP